MKMKRCKACQKTGKFNSASHSEYIYSTRSSTIMIKLCYEHSVEFFKTGQINFVNKYGPDFIDKDLLKAEPEKKKDYFDFNSFT